MIGIYGNGVQMTEKVLDFLWNRQNVTLNNIANVDTPGFKSQYVTFEKELQNRIRTASFSDKPGGLSIVFSAGTQYNGEKQRKADGT